MDTVATMKPILAIVFGLAAVTAAQAQSVFFGAGYADYSAGDAEDQAAFSLEYQHRPFHEAPRFSATWAVALTVDTDGDTHLGAGLAGHYRFLDRWFIEGSVLPGYYSESNSLNDLGGSFEIRSLLGFGYTLGSGNKVSMAITHISNASAQEYNPGVNSLFLRYHFAF